MPVLHADRLRYTLPSPCGRPAAYDQIGASLGYLPDLKQ